MTPPLVLVVDDDALVRRAAARTLEGGGFRTLALADARDAVDAVRSGGVAAVLSDIQMPGMDGIALLRAVRALDADVPVVLMTGSPTLESAIPAVEHGATLYLVKPINAAALLAGIGRAVTLGALAQAKRRALALVGNPGPGDLTALEVSFRRGLETLWPAFQPIVEVETRKVIAYEALLRTDEAEFRGPPEFVDAAERLGRVYALGRTIRAAVAAQASSQPEDVDIFVNLHPSDLMDTELHDPESPLSAHARRVVLEVTERDTLDGISNLAERIAGLRRMGYRIAVDDLGAGYAGLTSVVRLQPEVVKLDMTLVRDCDSDPARQQVLRSMAELSRALGMRVVAEGIETAAESSTLVAIGCGIQQGYYFARPARAWPTVSWPD